MNVVRETTIVGEIEEVLVDDQNRIVAVVIDKASREPGWLESNVLMPLDRLTFDPEARQATTTMTAEEIDALAAWPDDQGIVHRETSDGILEDRWWAVQESNLRPMD